MNIAPQRAALEQAALAELLKLTPPVSLALDWQQMIAARRTIIEKTFKLGEYAAAKNRQGEHSTFRSSASALRQIAASAKHGGFTDCGELG